MIELSNKSGIITVVDGSKSKIIFDTSSLKVSIDDLDVVHP
jgi:hypothetical protein